MVLLPKSLSLDRTTIILKWVLLTFGILNLLFVLIVIPAYSLIVTGGQTAAVGKYRNLVAYGVINQEQLNAFQGGRLAGEVAKVPAYLNEQLTGGIFGFSWVIVLVFLANAVFFFVLWYRIFSYGR